VTAKQAWFQMATEPSGRRNGLETRPRDYTYRGWKTLEVECPVLCDGGCGRRLTGTQGETTCAVCRGVRYYQPAQCERCGYKPGSRNCRILCQGEAGQIRPRSVSGGAGR
jgi:hypothetical protein